LSGGSALSPLLFAAGLAAAGAGVAGVVPLSVSGCCRASVDWVGHSGAIQPLDKMYESMKSL